MKLHKAQEKGAQNKAEQKTDLNVGRFFDEAPDRARLLMFAENMRTNLKGVDRSLNQSQLAVALWLAAARRKYNRLAVTVPAGLGKSRIMLGLALLLKYLGFMRVVIVFPTEMLLAQEQTTI